jgi:hypothetical protein
MSRLINKMSAVKGVLLALAAYSATPEGQATLTAIAGVYAPAVTAGLALVAGVLRSDPNAK